MFEIKVEQCEKTCTHVVAVNCLFVGSIRSKHIFYFYNRFTVTAVVLSVVHVFSLDICLKSILAFVLLIVIIL